MGGKGDLVFPLRRREALPRSDANSSHEPAEAVGEDGGLLLKHGPL
jgi:hypothetical protein